MPSVLDREVSDRERDAFGHRHFADALRSLIEAPSNMPPFSIGLLGPWGTGKSTIKELYLADLQKDGTGTNGSRRRDIIHTITFNAWRYGGEDIKRALLRHAYVELGGDEEVIRRELFHQVSEASSRKLSWCEWAKDAMAQNAASAAVFFLLLFGVLAVTAGFVVVAGVTGHWSLSIIGPVALVVVGWLATQIKELRLKAPSLFVPRTTITFPSTSAEEYEHLLIEQLRKFKQNKAGRRCERLVVFVDDLDRLSAAEMVEGLDAVRTFLELPEAALPDGLGVIFVISCDEDRVAEALWKGRGRLGSSELPGVVFTRSDARRYLDRLFQFRLEIPRFPKLDMRKYASAQLEQLDGVVQDLESRGVRVEDVLERLIHVGVQSPRNALQILNAFAQSWWIASQRERDAVGSDEPGGLYSGAVTNHPISLAALCVLRVDFPDFYNQLLGRPDLIHEFHSMVSKTGEVEQLSLGAQDALRHFFETDKDGQLIQEVRPECRDLRRYLSSLYGLRWPDRLQPLLLLSQDAISRRYGDRAAPLYDAFVSGDTEEVLEIFGRHLDKRPLDETDVRLLADLAEGVSHESELRRTNAARVLAGLVERVPAEHARSLMTPLARQMVALKSVRMHVGAKVAAGVIKHTTAIDQQEVVGRYIDDLLTGEKVKWMLPTGESPNLDELVGAVCDTVDVALAVRAKHGLASGSDKVLMAWLLGREVQGESGARSIPFSRLEEWVGAHQDELLKALGSDYSDLAIAEFEAENEDELDAAACLERVKIVFNRLAEVGEESRAPLWDQLTRLTKVRSSKAVDVARDTVSAHASLATPSQARGFLCSMADRLEKEMADEEAWPLDWKGAAKTFLELLGGWSESIDEATAESVSGLIISWSDVNETSEFAARGFVLLEAHSTSARDEVLDHLVAKSFGSLAWPSRELVASRVGDLTPKQATSLLAELDQLISSDNPEQEACDDYVRFVEATAKDAWAGKPLSQHLERLFARLEAMFQNQNEYLRKLLPAGRALLHAAPSGRAGTFLKNITEQSAGVPKAYVVLHDVLGGEWPVADEQIGSYGPDQVVERAVQFMEQKPAFAGVDAVLESIIDLVSRGVANKNCKPKVGQAAVATWPHTTKTIVRHADELAEMLSPSDIGKLLTGAQPSESESGDLEQVLGAAEKVLDDEQVNEVMRQILSENPVELHGAPDGAVSLWMDGVGDRLAGMLKALLADASLNDAQKERLYRGALARKNMLGLEFFQWALPSVLENQGMQRLRSAAIESRTEVASLANTAEGKDQLVSCVIPVLPKLGGDELANMLRLVRELGGKGALERATDVLDSMDDIELEIVAKGFPESQIFKKAAQARQSGGGV